ncbi:MAG: HEAT repeat domain-containing protein [Cyanobacteria bacterium J083]|nr:MAG: HEAT repeat domain-containing protein [Cyanobacteria bacterium J083]
MKIEEIKASLNSNDSQVRMRGITALKNYETEIAVPLLKSRLEDREFLVRSFVAMGLGKKQNADSFAALLKLMKFDRDPNVRAEAANSLSLFGVISASHLVVAFNQDDHWLVRRSILAALNELNCPEEMFEVAVTGIQGEDIPVAESSIDCLVGLRGSEKEAAALEQIINLATSDNWRIRQKVAQALGRFTNELAIAKLQELRSDPDHRVVAAVLESLLEF